MDWSYLICPIRYITSIGFTIDPSYPTSGAALPGGVGVGGAVRYTQSRLCLGLYLQSKPRAVCLQLKEQLS